MKPGAKKTEPLDESEHKYKGNCICKIFGKAIGTGSFSKMIYRNELIPVLITSYQVIDDKFVQSNNSLKVYVKEKLKYININKNKIIYSSPINEYDLIVIRLQDADIDYYLEIDENIFRNSENAYKNEPIYILYYGGKDGKAKISYGKGIKKFDEYDIKHFCNTEEGSAGSPILSAWTNKIIGIHKAVNRTKGYNFGIFLKYPLSELNRNKNEIICIYNKQKDEIDLLHDYTLDIKYWKYWTEENKKSYIEGKNNINENNIDIYINNKKIKFSYLI